MKNYRIFEEKLRTQLETKFGSDYCVVLSSKEYVSIGQFRHDMCSTVQWRFISEVATRLGLTWYINFETHSIVLY